MIYKLNAIAKCWYLKQNWKKKRRFLKKTTFYFNIRLSVAEELKTIKYVEERSIHVASNYYDVLKPTINYGIKEKEELIQFTKKWTLLHYKKINEQKQFHINNFMNLFYIKLPSAKL